MLPPAPDRDCPLCPRLAAFRDQNRKAFPGWHNAPVPSWGPLDSPLLILGLAPGLRGANRTGRPFTGDFAGKLLYATLLKFGLAQGIYGAEADDGLALTGARMTNAVRCLPPQNKPETSEIAACNRYLTGEIAAMPRLRAILALGGIAHNAVLKHHGLVVARYRFAHGALHLLPNGLILADSYHVSRYNTQTGRLTEAMFEAAMTALLARLGAG